MIVIGIDPHKQTHSAAAVERATGEVRGERTVKARERGHGELLRWARSLDSERVWALEDCRHVSGPLERFLLARGERVVRVPPGRMAGARKGGRERGKSDAIDALAVTRAFLRERDRPTAVLAGSEREIRLLQDHREDLVGERTRIQNRLRWHLHDLDPALEIPAGALDRYRWLDRLEAWLQGRDEGSAQVRIACELVDRCRELTRRVTELERELEALSEAEAADLLELVGCGTLTAAKLVGEVAGVGRFGADGKLAKHSGTVPCPRPRASTSATGSTARATASSTAPCIGSPSRRPACIRPRAPTSSASRPRARVDARPCAASSVTSPAPCIARFEPWKRGR